MAGNVHRFRRLKHSDPPKFKVLAEDQRPRRRGSSWIALLLVLALGLGYSADDLARTGMATYAVSQVSPSCNIKGNVSIDTDERIYHVPGQKYYSRTRISPQYGERWFCSEAEARAAGWRKSRT